MDINTKKLKKNAFRVTKVRNKTASRIRVPGGHLEAKYLPVLKHMVMEHCILPTVRDLRFRALILKRW